MFSFQGLVLGLVTQVRHRGATSLPQSLVRLPSLLDTLATIAVRSDHVADILNRQRHLLAAAGSPKEALASLTEALRTELVREEEKNGWNIYLYFSTVVIFPKVGTCKGSLDDH